MLSKDAIWDFYQGMLSGDPWDDASHAETVGAIAGSFVGIGLGIYLGALIGGYVAVLFVAPILWYLGALVGYAGAAATETAYEALAITLGVILMICTLLSLLYGVYRFWGVGSM